MGKYTELHQGERDKQQSKLIGMNVDE